MFQLYAMTFSLRSILEAILNPEFKKTPGSARTPPPPPTPLFSLEAFNNARKQLLNSDWLKKECSSPLIQLQICNTSTN